MNTKKSNQRHQPDEEAVRVKEYKHRKHQFSEEEIIDNDELDEEVYDFIKRHLK